MTAISFNKRTGALVLAIVMAALATFVLLSYVRGLEREALAQADPVPVYVAKDVVSTGMTVDEAISKGLFVREMLPRRAVVDGAVSDLEDIRHRVVAADILKGEQILAQRFAAPDEHRPLLDVPEGHQALSVQAATPPGVAGFVKVGDRVSLIANVGGDGGQRVQYVVQTVEVLAVGSRGQQSQNTSGSAAGDQTEGGILLTLALTSADAEKVAYVVMNGDLYFTLVPPGQEAQPSPGRTIQNLFS